MTGPKASALADVTDALVAAFTAALPVPVFDGPQAQRPTDPQFVLVGASEIDGNDGEEASSNSNRSDMGNGGLREDTGEVTCSAWAWSGDTDLAALRRQALGLVDRCQDVLTAAPQLGGALPFGYYADVGSVRIRQEQTGSGALARVTFSVTYTTLLF